MEEHFIISNRSVEQMEREAAAFEKSTTGQQFKRRIQKAIDFEDEHLREGLTVGQVDYIANKHKNNLLNGCTDLLALGYMQGYKEAIEDAKEAQA